jgi:hypothetical protein
MFFFIDDGITIFLLKRSIIYLGAATQVVVCQKHPEAGGAFYQLLQSSVAIQCRLCYNTINDLDDSSLSFHLGHTMT